MRSQSVKSLRRSIVTVILFIGVVSHGLFGLESDIGLRAYDGTEIIKVAVDANHTIYSLKIHKEGTTYGVMLVDPAHPDASKYRISTGSGIKALKKFDETPPTLTQVTISSTNSNSSFATVGDNVTISFTASEALLALPTVTIDGNTVGSITNPSGNNYTATRTMQNGDTDGQIAFTIDFVDNAANPGTQVTSITTGENVIFDEFPPILVTGIALNKTTTTIVVGSTEQIVATVSPPNAADQSVGWSSNNPAVASVSSNGTVVAIAAGAAVITAETIDGGFTDTCVVTVISPNFLMFGQTRYVSALSGDPEEIYAGDYQDFIATAISTHTNTSGQYTASASQTSLHTSDLISAAGSANDYGPFYALENHSQEAHSSFLVHFTIDAQSVVILTGELENFFDTGGTNVGVSSYSVSLSQYQGTTLFAVYSHPWDGYAPPVTINEILVLESGSYTLYAEASAGTDYYGNPQVGMEMGGGGNSQFSIELSITPSQ